jgi:hypothetical protein
MLQAWLDFHRQTLLWKCEGLTPEQLKTAASPPSNLTLIGLVRHMAEVERGWWAPVVGTDRTWLYCTEDDLDGDFDNVADADVEADFATFRREVELYDATLGDYDLDHLRHGRERDYSLRWVYLHMIEEYARHNGHADLIREALDGSTGD